jgi:hypothetical protein
MNNLDYPSRATNDQSQRGQRRHHGRPPEDRHRPHPRRPGRHVHGAEGGRLSGRPPGCASYEERHERMSRRRTDRVALRFGGWFPEMHSSPGASPESASVAGFRVVAGQLEAQVIGDDQGLLVLLLG